MSEHNKKIAINDIVSSGADLCFVAMDFSRKFTPVYDEILETVIVNNGMEPVRSDNILSAAGYVVSEIDLVIQSSRVVIVDITGCNPNVLIEVGMACALKKTIILITQDEKIPFDIQARRVIHYDLSGSGKQRLKKDLAMTLKSAVYPTESSLQHMLDHNCAMPTYIIYGQAKEDHIKEVYPPVDSKYLQRLQKMSSETSGIWDITLAYQKIAWSQGKEQERLITTDGYRANKEILTLGNAFIFGGPGANPFFNILIEELTNRYSNILSIRSSLTTQGLNRFRLYKGLRVYPTKQDELLSQAVDVGMVMRFPNPFCPGATIWMAAGIRTFGTEAAIKALVTQSLIIKIKQHIDISHSDIGFWAVVKATFDEQSQALLDVSVHHSGKLEPIK